MTQHAVNKKGWVKPDPKATARMQQFTRGLLDKKEGKPFGFDNQADVDVDLDAAYRRGWHHQRT